MSHNKVSKRASVLLNFASCLVCWWLLGKVIIIQCKSPNLFAVNVLASRPCPARAGLHLESAADQFFKHLETRERKYMFHKLLRSARGTTVNGITMNYACSTSYFHVAHKQKHKLIIVDNCGVIRSYIFLHSSNNIEHAAVKTRLTCI